jgi:mRNA interferase RelE/StbE
MAWRIELSGQAQRNLKQLDRKVAQRILVFLHGRLAQLDDPRSIGQAIKGSVLGQFWKYRVGDWRIIASIEDRNIRILVVRIGNQRDVYR